MLKSPCDGGYAVFMGVVNDGELVYGHWMCDKNTELPIDVPQIPTTIEELRKISGISLLWSHTMKCPVCGETYGESWRFCPKHGERLVKSESYNVHYRHKLTEAVAV